MTATAPGSLPAMGRDVAIVTDSTAYLPPKALLPLASGSYRYRSSSTAVPLTRERRSGRGSSPRRCGDESESARHDRVRGRSSTPTSPSSQQALPPSSPYTSPATCPVPETPLGWPPRTHRCRSRSSTPTRWGWASATRCCPALKRQISAALSSTSPRSGVGGQSARRRSSTSTRWSTSAEAGGSAPPRRCSVPPRSSRCCTSRTGRSSRWRRSGRLPGRSLGWRSWRWSEPGRARRHRRASPGQRRAGRRVGATPAGEVAGCGAAGRLGSGCRDRRARRSRTACRRRGPAADRSRLIATSPQPARRRAGCPQRRPDAGRWGGHMPASQDATACFAPPACSHCSAGACGTAPARCAEPRTGRRGRHEGRLGAAGSTRSRGNPEPPRVGGSAVLDRVPLRLREAVESLPEGVRGGRLGLESGHAIVVILVVLLALAVAALLLGLGRPRVESVGSGVSASVIATGTPATGVVESESQGASDRGSAQLVVHVAGLVHTPGVVRLPAGARVLDAVEAAGGARDGVDLTGLNLARLVTDGEQVFVGVSPPAGSGNSRCRRQRVGAGEPQHRYYRSARGAARNRACAGGTHPGLAGRAWAVRIGGRAPGGVGHRTGHVRRARRSGHRVNAVAPDRPDLRLVPAAAATWAGVLVGVNNPGPPLGWLCMGVAVGALVVARIAISRPARLAVRRTGLPAGWDSCGHGARRHFAPDRSTSLPRNAPRSGSKQS